MWLRLERDLLLTFSLSDHIQKGERLVLRENLILLPTKDFLVLPVNLPYYGGVSEGVRVRYQHYIRDYTSVNWFIIIGTA